MSDLENAMGLQHEKSGILNCPSSVLRTSGSEMANNSVSMSDEPSNVANPFLASSAWDPLVSLNQVQSFGGTTPMVSHSDFSNSLYPPPLVMENNHQGMSTNSHHHLVQYMSDSNFGDIVPKVQLQPYGSGSFSEMVGTFVQPGSGGIANTGYLPNYNPSNEVGIERGQINNEHSQGQGEASIAQEGDQGSAPTCENTRKRGLDYNSTLSPNKNVEGDVIKDCSGKSSDGMKEHGEKKPKMEQDTSPPVQGKQSAKQSKDNSHSGEAPKENFVHVRARRGQATNSHSLAERVRREKISERMRVLQELVPGCNKITGKAVMLDEIINYVQSLQQQVEFLSMKLATVNPELNIDLERILSKDILQSRVGHGPIGGYGSGSINCSQPFTAASYQGTLVGMAGTSAQLPPLPQAVIDHEFQSLYGMSYDSNAVLDNMGPNNGRLKSEL